MPLPELIPFCSSQFVAPSPQAKTGICDEEYVFAADSIVTMLEFRRIVLLDCFAKVAEREADAFHFCFREISGTERDLESALGRAWNQMSGCSETIRKVWVPMY